MGVDPVFATATSTQYPAFQLEVTVRLADRPFAVSANSASENASSSVGASTAQPVNAQSSRDQRILGLR